MVCLVISKALQDAVRRLLRPLVKAMIDGGLTYPWLAGCLRETYVEIARSDYRIGDKPPTQSRIAVLTGVHRKEIRRLAAGSRAVETTPTSLPLSSRVIALWCSDQDYTDAEGRPRPLPRTAPENEPSLEALVGKISSDVYYRSLLEEWLRLDLVEDDGERVRLKQAGLVPANGFEEIAYYFGANLRDHIAAGAHNLAGLEPAFFDRAVTYEGLSDRSVEELRASCKAQGEALMLKINRQARTLADQDRIAGRETGRIAFGAYFFAENSAELRDR